MPKNAYIHTRIDPDIKRHAELVFSKLGLSLTDAVSLFFTQVALRDGLPFSLTIPLGNEAYAKEKQALFESQKIRLNAMIEEAVGEVRAGQAYTPGEAKARTNAYLKSLLEYREADSTGSAG